MVKNNKDDIKLENKKAEPLTCGFVQVWLDVVSISSSSLLGFGSGLDVSNLAFSSYLQLQFFNRLLFGAGRSMNATPAQSPVRYAQPYWDTTLTKHITFDRITKTFKKSEKDN